MKNIYTKVLSALAFLGAIFGAVLYFRKPSKSSDTEAIVEDMFQSQKDSIAEEKKAVEEKEYSNAEIEEKFK